MTESITATGSLDLDLMKGKNVIKFLAARKLQLRHVLSNKIHVYNIT